MNRATKKDNLTGLFSPFLRKRRILVARKYLKGRVLDFGCGIGHVAEYVDHKSYVGVDKDNILLAIASKKFPLATFLTLSELGERIFPAFDTIVGLAILEHLEDPEEFLGTLKKLLNPSGQIVITSPNPGYENVLTMGSKLGLFDKEMIEEHQSLLSFDQINKLAQKARLKIVVYRRFLINANQLVVIEHA